MLSIPPPQVLNNFWKQLEITLNEQLVTDVLAAEEFSVLADESMDTGDRSQMAVFIRFVNVTSHKVQERFLGVVKLAKSKKAEDLHDIIMKLLEA